MNNCTCNYEVWEVNPLTGMNELVTRDGECECRLYRLANDAAAFAKTTQAFGYTGQIGIHGSSIASVERLAKANNKTVHYTKTEDERTVCWVDYAPGVVIYGRNE